MDFHDSIDNLRPPTVDRALTHPSTGVDESAFDFLVISARCVYYPSFPPTPLASVPICFLPARDKYPSSLAIRF